LQYYFTANLAFCVRQSKCCGHLLD